MGMFDYLHYEGKEYQTKDTPAQLCDNYKIEDGCLWHEDYDAEWVYDESSFFGMHLNQTNHHWVFCNNFDGDIRFYREDKENGGWKADNWIEYKALFMDGKLLKIEKIDDGN